MLEKSWQDGRVDELTSGQVNELLVDRVSKRQSNIGTRSLKLTSKHLFICFLVFSRKQLVYLSTRSLVHFLTKHLFTCYFVFSHKQLVYPSTRLLVYLLTKYLFICYFVFSHKQLVYSSTCSLVYLLTRSLVHFLTFSHFIFLPFNFLFIFALSIEK